VLVLLSLALLAAVTGLISRQLRFGDPVLSAVFVSLAFWGLLYVYTESVGSWSYSPQSLLLTAIGLLAATLIATFTSRRLRSRADHATSEQGARASPDLPSRKRAYSAASLSSAASLAIMVLVILWLAAAVEVLLASPVRETDTFSYHFPTVVAWLSHGDTGIHPQLDYRISYWPHGVHALYGAVTMVTGDARLLGVPNLLIAGVLWPFAVYFTLRQLGIATALAVLCAALASINVVWMQQAKATSTDVTVAALFVLSIGLLLVFRASVDGKRVLLLACALGLLAASKASGLVFAIVLAFAALVCAVLAYRHGETTLRRILAAGAVLLVISFGIGGFTYWRNLLVAGNPFYPAPVSFAGFVFEQPAVPHLVDWFRKTSFVEAFAWSLWIPLKTMLKPWAFGPVTTGIALCLIAAAVIGVVGHFAGSAQRQRNARQGMRDMLRAAGGWRLATLVILFVCMVLVRKGHIGTTIPKHAYFFTFTFMLLFAWLLEELGARWRKALSYFFVAIAAISAPFVWALSTNFLSTDLATREISAVDIIAERDAEERLSQSLGEDATLVVTGTNVQVPYRYMADPYRKTYVAMAYGPNYTDPSTDVAPAPVYERIWTFITGPDVRELIGWYERRPYDFAAALEVGSPYLHALADKHCIRNIVSTVGPIPAHLLWDGLDSAGRLGPDYWYRVTGDCTPRDRPPQ
jgi:hypothetical protein